MIWLLFYIPVLLAFYVMATRYKQISPLWIVFLLLSLFTGGGPIVALIFLAANKKMLQGEAQPAANMAQTPVSQTTVYPEAIAGTLAPNTAQPSTFQVTPKKAGTALGGVVSVILWVSGLAVVGFFVMVTIAVIQCSNDPKCI
ncbi:MAG: hypothetical protein WCO19_03540 [Candidatus Saccharibacteria bacterium]